MHGTHKRDKKDKDTAVRGLCIPGLLLLFVVCALAGCSSEGSFSSTLQGSVSALFHREQKSSVGETEDELLILVNPWNSLPEGYQVELYTMSDGTQVAERCIDDLRQLLQDCRAAGCEPYICSGYRTWDYQAMLFENKVKRLMDQGFDEITARAEAATVVALPGTSEHQLGLAVDIIDSSYTELDEGQEDTATQHWLMENSWKYGFILRYPEGKSDVTGIIYEPWHYRYVGVENAREIHESGLCFEEWLEQR